MKNLKRYPYKKNDLLQAWDAADELIVKHAIENNLSNKKTLVINDQFGAISSELERPIAYTDSYVSYKGTLINTNERVSPLSDLQEVPGSVEQVFVQLPKNLSFFEDILCVLSTKLVPGTPFIFTGMVKHMSPGHFDLINKYIGATRTSLAEKKARLIFACLEKSSTQSPYPLHVKMDGFELPITNHSNLFSREKLDIGTRFMLENIPLGHGRILDLGCGNGLLGIRAKQLNKNAHLSFSDESQMAIKSARENYRKFFNDDMAEFFWTNCFEEGREAVFDLVLCNPPFHQSNTVGDFIALQMFEDAYRVLRSGGLLRIIGNSHLGYQIKMKKIFGNSKIIKTNQKFMIVDSVKP